MGRSGGLRLSNQDQYRTYSGLDKEKKETLKPFAIEPCSLAALNQPFTRGIHHQMKKCVYSMVAKRANRQPVLSIPSQLQLQLQLGPGPGPGQIHPPQPRPGVVDGAKQDSFLLVVEHSNQGPEPSFLFSLLPFASSLLLPFLDLFWCGRKNENIIDRKTTFQ